MQNNFSNANTPILHVLNICAKDLFNPQECFHGTSAFFCEHSEGLHRKLTLCAFGFFIIF